MGDLQTLFIVFIFQLHAYSTHRDLSHSTSLAANAEPIFTLIGARAARLPATNNRYRHWKAGAKPVTRTVVAAVCAAIVAAVVAAVVAAMTATNVSAVAAVAAVAAVGAFGESVSRNERAAQHEGNGEGSCGDGSCRFAKHVLVSLNVG
jgi:hypothetical protein